MTATNFRSGYAPFYSDVRLCGERQERTLRLLRHRRLAIDWSEHFRDTGAGRGGHAGETSPYCWQ